MSSGIIDKNTLYFNRRSIRLQGYDYAKKGTYFITICTNEHENMFGEIIDNKMTLNGLGEIAGSCWTTITEHFPNVVLDEYVVMPNHMHGIISISNDNPVVVGAGLAPALYKINKSALGKINKSALNKINKSALNNINKSALGNINNHASDNIKKHDLGIINNPASDNIKKHDLGIINNPALNIIKNSVGNINNVATAVYINRATARVAPTVGNIVGAFKSIVSNECLKLFKMDNKRMGKIWQRNYYEHIIRNEKELNNIRDYIMNNVVKWSEDENNPMLFNKLNI